MKIITLHKIGGHMMEYNEEDYLTISGIQSFTFCKRQWALTHIEQQWEENALTAEGKQVHNRVDQPFIREKRDDRLIVRAMPVKSNKLGITGICDTVEFIKDENGIEIHGAEGKFLVYPTEYKRGRPKAGYEDIFQLVAQAICLEEMLLCSIEKGGIFYNETRRRIEIPFTDELKEQVKVTVNKMQDYYRRRHTPKVKTGHHCNNCSLKNICLPKLMSKQSVKKYIEGKIAK